jgi:hypothetical protein
MHFIDKTDYKKSIVILDHGTSPTKILYKGC